MRRLDRPVQRRVIEALDRLVAEPPQGDIVKLAGVDEEWRLRVGDWRVRLTSARCLTGGFESVAHLTAQDAQLYRATMGAFVAAKRGFVVHLRPEDVHAALVSERPELDPAAVGDALAQLVEAGEPAGRSRHESRRDPGGLPMRAVPVPSSR